MVTKWGMSERLGPVSYKLSDEDPFLGREMHQHRQFSEHTLQIVDEEVAHIMHTSFDRALDILTRNRDKLDKLAAALVAQEEIDENEIRAAIGPSVHHEERTPPADTEKAVARDAVGRC
jgi:cell division protease FtsH